MEINITIQGPQDWRPLVSWAAPHINRQPVNPERSLLLTSASLGTATSNGTAPIKTDINTVELIFVGGAEKSFYFPPGGTGPDGIRVVLPLSMFTDCYEILTRSQTTEVFVRYDEISHIFEAFSMMGTP